MFTEIPLRKLKAQWIKGDEGDRVGISFDCPVCLVDPHRLEVGTDDPQHWESQPVYRCSGETLPALSLFPTIVGGVHHDHCGFRGWVKLGRVQWKIPEQRRTAWLDI